MKTTILPVEFFATSILCHAQYIDREVVSSSGNYFEGANSSISWTLGKIATETLTDGNFILTQGFQHPFGIIDLDVLVYLEGPYNAGSMNTNLKDRGQIPLDQPYNISPWFYTGTENVLSIPDDVVDWVLIDLRDASSAIAANLSTSVEMQSAFIQNNGSVVGLDGSSILQFSATISIDPYVVVWHRNHHGILSATSPVEMADIYTYDFSTVLNQTHGAGDGYKLIDNRVYGMAGGDANSDGIINATNRTLWAGQAGTNDYKPTV